MQQSSAKEQTFASEEEFADALSDLLDRAHTIYEIDLESPIHAKEQINERRTRH